MGRQMTKSRQIDSTVVSSAVSAELRPILLHAGFDEITSRKAWRRGVDRVDVVSFEAVNASDAQSLGCTRHSLSVRVGIYLRAVPGREVAKGGKGRPPRPEMDDCHFRRTLTKSLPQRELPRTDIWFLDDRGANLSDVVRDLERTFRRDALPWFRRFDEPGEILRTLAEDEQYADGGTWGFGRNPSPLRHFLIGHIALGVDKVELALSHFELVLESGAFPEYDRELKAVLRRIAPRVLVA
jgi:hypothetical protein